MTFVPPLTAQEVEDACSEAYSNLAIVHAGGQGVVFRAEVLGETSALVALKLYFPTIQGYLERSAREVEALRQVRCPTVVKLHDSGSLTVRGQVCPLVATTFVEGDTVAERLASGPLNVQTTARLGHDVALAIDALWAVRVVHRDLKPSNIMLANAGGAVVIDLGVARHLSLDSLTSTGATWGTHGYFSPEQARAWKQLTCKSDIFALGVVMQQCLIGRHPTGGAQQPLLRGGIPTLRLASATAPALATIIDSMLQQNPIVRPLPATVARELSPLF